MFAGLLLSGKPTESRVAQVLDVLERDLRVLAILIALLFRNAIWKSLKHLDVDGAFFGVHIKHRGEAVSAGLPRTQQ